jgi:hypothetical protein
LAKSLHKVNNSHTITSILITREEDIELPNPVVKMVVLRDRDVGETTVIGMAELEKGKVDLAQSRGERVTAKLRTDQQHPRYIPHQEGVGYNNAGTTGSR